MIESFKHKGLRRFWLDDESKLLNAEHLVKIDLILNALETAWHVEELALPGFRLHQLTGSSHGLWSITVRANWRIVFRFAEGGAWDVDLVDYH